MKTGIITRELVQTMIGKREREIHKGDCGRILIAAGSRGMAGAAVLSARAALRAGSGLVQMAVPNEIFPIIQTAAPEATCLDRDFSKIDLSRYDAAAAGPGLGESEESVRTVTYLIENFDGKLVLDADALNIIAHNDLFDLLRARRPMKTVITPHTGEAGRLLGETLREPQEPAARQIFREETALKLAEKTGAVSVLKGQGTIVAFDTKTAVCGRGNDGTGPVWSAYTNTTGNPGMATAGSGDVLTGIITSLAGQRKPDGHRFSAAGAAVCGVYVHGLAGDLAAKSTGEYGLIAGDTAYYTALALKMISG